MSWYTGRNSKRVYLVDRGDELYRDDCPDYKVIVVDTSSVYTYYNLKCMGDRYMAATMRKKSNDFQKEFSPVHGDPMSKEELNQDKKKDLISSINILIFGISMFAFNISFVISLLGADGCIIEQWQSNIILFISLPILFFQVLKW